MQFQSFFQVGEGFLFGFALAGNVNLKALRDVPVVFAPNRCKKRPLHGNILAHESTPNKALAVATDVVFSIVLVGGGVVLDGEKNNRELAGRRLPIGCRMDDVVILTASSLAGFSDAAAA